MAYSIISQPDAASLQYSNGDIVTVVQQTDYDPTFYKDYKFWAKLKVNGVESVTLKSFPEPGTDKGVFNLNGIASAFTKYDYTFNDTEIFSECPDSSCTLQLMLGEEYNFNGTFFSQTQTSGNTFIALNASPWKDDPALSEYILGTSDKKFLNKATEIRTSSTFGNQYLFYCNSAGEFSPAAKLEIACFTTLTVGNYEGLRGIYRINNSLVDSSGTQRVNVGISGLEKIMDDEIPYDVIYGASDLFNPSVNCWQVCMTNEGGEKTSEIITVYLDTECYNYPEPLQLFWLNNLGGFDSYIFNSKNITSTNKTTQSFKKQSGRLLGNEYVTNSFDQTNIKYFTQLRDTIELTATWLSDNDVKLLHSLFASPVVFYKGADGIMYAGSIDDSDYKLIYRKHQKKYDLTLKLKPSATYVTQLQ